MKKYKWGIIGLGKIAHKFAADLITLPNAELYGVASSSAQRAEAFGAQYGAIHSFGSYAELVALEDLDVVYIATPHAFHKEHTLLCLRQGKHVLCEKPFALNSGEAAEMIALARERGLFLMEALWTRFIPLFKEMLKRISGNAIGEVQTVKADFGFNAAAFSPESRIWDIQLGGGALLDIGIYPLYIATVLLGVPERMQAAATFSATKVDDNFAAILSYPNKKQALLHASLTLHTATEAWIYGSAGNIHIHNRFHHPHRMTIYDAEGAQEEIRMSYDGFGYQFEAAELMRCLDAGLLECPEHDLDMTMRLMGFLDALRGQIGLSYPQDS